MTKKDTSSLLSLCAIYVQKYDPDYFYCALFAPSFHRELIFRLLAFNIEITRAVSLPSSWSVAGPMAGFIRLQWWRELIEGKDRTHEIAPFICEAISQGLLSSQSLLELIEAKEEELDGIKNWEHWESLLMRSSGKIQATIAQILGVEETEHLQGVASLGVAYEVTRLARNLPKVLASGRCPLPQDIIDEHQLQRTDDGIPASPETIVAIRTVLRAKALDYLKAGRNARALGRKKIAAALPAALAKRDLKKHHQWDQLLEKRGVGDQLAVIWSNFKGKVSF
ncbi:MULTISPECIES: squalene/phytoene synthase family protein [Commensalibacter]|uniref:Phytoene synthase n=2 Tax=Commensalibacter TaxID=1079922 RepID=W7E8C0_9PROT|nr:MULTISPECIES: squalene/phytoene synthase family protein [Commensalibacter]EUK19396.1 phytoene synthase [Commensalibacter papalotli (ex Servin-Garciduenas et al. 2014)]CAI3934674.1 Phytoene/squalene synthetase (ERG9) (PDB:3WEK) [Commensalibacter papalotli (ex Botero et al. 2024)]CAI3950779.1 Phytoene/squalene synthetase (ERG9) (PDB:3WEK) [Commensalibacter papalotli (ex Botero et al. 2024)]